MKEEKKARSILDKYRMVLDPKSYTKIEETINRRHLPNQLTLYGIYDEGELIYKEKPAPKKQVPAALDTNLSANMRLKAA